MKHQRECRVCGWRFWTSDRRQKDCGSVCREVMASICQSKNPTEYAVEKAKKKYQTKMDREFVWQDFCFGRRIVFR